MTLAVRVKGMAVPGTGVAAWVAVGPAGWLAGLLARAGVAGPAMAAAGIADRMAVAPATAQAHRAADMIGAMVSAR